MFITVASGKLLSDFAMVTKVLSNGCCGKFSKIGVSSTQIISMPHFQVYACHISLESKEEDSSVSNTKSPGS